MSDSTSDSANDASKGVAATPCAVYNAYTRANDAYKLANNAAVKNHQHEGTGANSIVLGYNVFGNNKNSIAIGVDASAENYNTIMIGCNTHSNSGWGSIAIGSNICSNYKYITSYAIGENIIQSSSCTSSYGGASYAAFGSNINLTSVQISNSALIGQNITIGGHTTVALGSSINSSGICGIFIGEIINSNKWGSVAIGRQINISGNESIVIGRQINMLHNNSIAIATDLAYGDYLSSISDKTIQLGGPSNSKISYYGSLSNASDIRDKIDIKLINNSIEFLNKINAITYVRNDRVLYKYEDIINEDGKEIIKNEKLTNNDRKNRKYGLCGYDKESHAAGTKKGSRRRSGIVAQEVQQAMLDIYGTDNYANLVMDNLYDYNSEEIPEGVESQLEVNYTGFIPFIIKAIQELSTEINILKDKVKTLEGKA